MSVQGVQPESNSNPSTVEAKDKILFHVTHPGQVQTFKKSEDESI